MCDSHEWQRRETLRFSDGTYKHAPWYDDHRIGIYWLERDHPAKHHYAHISNDDPRQIAFTMSDEHGKADRQTRMKPGRYLTRYFSDRLTEHEIRELANTVSAMANPVLKFATTADEIQHVYENSYQSCMGHDESHFESSIHPTRVYAAGDLAVAYLDGGKKALARALCWPARKTYGRVYAEHEFFDPFREVMAAAGFDDSAEFEGARLQKVMDGSAYVLPYLDAGFMVDDCGSHLVMTSNGGIAATSTNGLVGGGSTCDRCERTIDPDYSYTVGDEQWCESCYGNYSSHCERCEESYRDNEVRTVIQENGSETYLCESCRYRVHAVECDSCSSLCEPVLTVEQRAGYRNEYCENCVTNGDVDYHECEECGDILAGNHPRALNGAEVGYRWHCSDCLPAEEEIELENARVDERQNSLPL